MGLDDRDALRVLHDAFATTVDGNGLAALFFSRWFGADPSVREMFPADLDAPRTAFAHAMSWVYSELVAQRAEEPIAFLAQLGRDHRKHGVTHRDYDILAQVLLMALRERLADAWTDAVETAARESLNLITGVMSGAADAEQGPSWWEGPVVEYHRVSRDLGVVRLQLDRPLPYHPGQYVKVEVPQCPRLWRYLSPAMPATSHQLPVFYSPFVENK